MLPIRLCSPSFPFFHHVVSIVFTWLFGEPSCGETTLLNSPSEQMMVYIRATERHSLYTLTSAHV